MCVCVIVMAGRVLSFWCSRSLCLPRLLRLGWCVRVERRAQQVVESDWIATIAFTYTRAPMSVADRLRNPLGFQVLEYRRDQESAPSPGTAGAQQ